MDNSLQANDLPASPRLPNRSRPATRALLAFAACTALFAGGYGVVRWAMSNGQAAVPPLQADSHSKYFVGWRKPDFALVITGQNFGYLQPCGCSEPQYGGLVRRWEFVQSLKSKGWNVVALDLGDLYPKNSDTPSQQNLLKFETAMRALHVIGYHAVGVGKQELGVPLINALGQYSVNNPRPRPVAANLAGIEENGIYHALNARAAEVIDIQGLPKIGVIGMIGKSVQEAALKHDVTLKFDKALVVAGLKDLAAQNTNFNVALFQTDDKLAPGGEPEVDKCLAWCSQQQQTPLHVVVHSSDDPEPPGLPRNVGDTQVISVGHKGKYVGVLGVWRNKGQFEYKYELVLMGPEFEPKAGGANPVATLMEEYSKRVADNPGLLAGYLKVKHKSQVILWDEKKIETRYAGSEICGNCHQHAHQIWSGAKEQLGHFKAFKTLEEAKSPKLRQFDGECIQCHTTGFKHDTGYNDASIKPRMKKELLNVGCESCHGPSSAHANAPNDPFIRKLINPWAKQHNAGLPEHVRMQRINTFCQSCHDIENDVHWDFTKSWPKVIHMNPPAAKGK